MPIIKITFTSEPSPICPFCKFGAKNCTLLATAKARKALSISDEKNDFGDAKVISTYLNGIDFYYISIMECLKYYVYHQSQK